MASSGGGFDTGAQTIGGATVRDGPELQEIQTDLLGFAGLNPETETQIRLLPTPWHADALPPPSSSLLAVASSKGVIAAAGPDVLVIATTASVREALMTADEKKLEKVRPFEPQLKIPKSRLGQIAFSSNEEVLVISAQEGGGLEAFQVSALLNGQTHPALQVSTNGSALRALVPNPAFDLRELFAAVTVDGDLLLLDLNAGGLRNGANGPALRTGVSCLSWSNKGKQLVAGLASGTVVQLKPDGTVVAEIPKSTNIPDGYHVSGISWLENDSFFIIYTPNSTAEGIMLSEYYIVTRKPKSTDFTFQKLPEIVPGFGMKRIPTFHFMTRLRNFPPHIQDLLVVSATSGSDIGLISKADSPLSTEDAVTGDFTFTMISSDGRRAQLPLSGDTETDTSPIGMALDLSSKDLVPRPIPSEPEVEQTQGPCPNILVLNNEGILLSWWLIYNDSVKQNTLFSSFHVQSPASNSVSSSGINVKQTPSESSQSPFAAPKSAFGAPLVQPSSESNSGSAFGQSSTIGNPKSSWASTGFDSTSSNQGIRSGFGQPAFGSTATLGPNSSPAFGTASPLGKPPFGQPSGALGKPSFGTGTSGFGNNALTNNAFGAASAASPGFASFSQKGGFGGFGGTGQPSSSSSALAKVGRENTFSFGNTPSGSFFDAFGGSLMDGNKPKPEGIGSLKIQSSFKGDGTAGDDLPKPSQPSGFSFGAGLDDMLGDSTKVISPTHDKEEEMEEGEVAEDSASEKEDQRSSIGFSLGPSGKPPQTLITPPSTLGQPKATPALPVSNLFGMSADQSTTPAGPQSTGFSFGPLPSTTPKETPAPQSVIFGTKTQPDESPAVVQKSQPKPLFDNIPKLSPEPNSSESKAPQIKQEPPSDDEAVDLDKIPPAPLPPDTTSKERYVSGDTSASSINSKATDPTNDAPLPPDFLPANKSATTKAEEEVLPSEDESELSEGFEEGSGEDVEEEISPVEGTTEDGLDDPSEDHTEQVQTSPESSFKSGEHSPETSPTGGLFTKVSSNTGHKAPMRPLFGEVGSTGPILPPPKPHESPRSPSPVRRLPPKPHEIPRSPSPIRRLPPMAEALRSEPARSVSAPAHGRTSIIDKRRAEAASSSAQAQARIDEELAKQKSQQAALAQKKVEEAARELENLEDDEDERLRRELEAPVTASESLQQFVTYRSKTVEEGSKSGVPAQIERLYQDVNCMIDTLGINARALSAYMLYQQGQQPNQVWPSVLTSETPMDALNDEWLLGDIPRLHEGQDTLEETLSKCQINDSAQKLQQCHILLSQDIVELRTRLASIRKTLHAKQSSDMAMASSLSAEQASVQQDLRKVSASVHNKLGQVEDALSILRAKLAEAGALGAESKRPSMFGRSGSQKMPTVESVMNTIGKMTTMAEKKSANIDVLEAQLKKLNMSGKNGIAKGAEEVNNTPGKNRRSLRASTPGSSNSSVYHTPDSKFSASVRSTPSKKGANRATMVISAEDREMWQAKARRKKEAAAVLRSVLAERRKQRVSKT